MVHVVDHKPRFKEGASQEMVHLVNRFFIQDAEPVSHGNFKPLSSEPIQDSVEEHFTEEITDQRINTKSTNEISLQSSFILLITSFVVLSVPLNTIIKTPNSLLFYLLQSALTVILFWIITRFF